MQPSPHALVSSFVFPVYFSVFPVKLEKGILRNAALVIYP